MCDDGRIVGESSKAIHHGKLSAMAKIHRRTHLVSERSTLPTLYVAAIALWGHPPVFAATARPLLALLLLLLLLLGLEACSFAAPSRSQGWC